MAPSLRTPFLMWTHCRGAASAVPSGPFIWLPNSQPPHQLPVLGVQRVPGRGALHSGRGEQHLLCQRLSHVSPGAVGQVTPAVSPASPGASFPPCLSGFSIPDLSTSSLPISRSSVVGAGPGSVWNPLLDDSAPVISFLSLPLPACSVFLVGGGGGAGTLSWLPHLHLSLCSQGPTTSLGGGLGASAESFPWPAGVHVSSQSFPPAVAPGPAC